MFMPKPAMYALNFLIFWAYTFAVYMLISFIFGFIEGAAGSDFNFNTYGVAGALAVLVVIGVSVVKHKDLYLNRN